MVTLMRNLRYKRIMELDPTLTLTKTPKWVWGLALFNTL